MTTDCFFFFIVERMLNNEYFISCVSHVTEFRCSCYKGCESLFESTGTQMDGGLRSYATKEFGIWSKPRVFLCLGSLQNTHGFPDDNNGRLRVV